MRNLENKAVLISGGTSGIGASVLEACKKTGMNTMSVSRHLNKLPLNNGSPPGRDTAYFKGDVTKYSDLEKISHHLNDDGVNIDVLICNAGVGVFDGDFLTKDVELLKPVIDVNLIGTLNCLKAFDQNLNKNFCDVIVIGSVSGRRAYAGSIYSVSKSALDSLVSNYRCLISDRAIRVTQILPGTVSNTNLFDHHTGSKLDPSDIARSVLFCLEQSREVQISEMIVTGTKF